MKEKKKLLNYDIKASRVVFIAGSGDNLGELPMDEVRQKAEAAGLDLMQIGMKGDLPIVKMLDYGKYLYQRKKQDQKNKQKSKAPEMKTIRITYKIGEHDLMIRKNQAEKFAKTGHSIKVTLTLRGRENYYAEIAEEKMKEFLNMISDFYDIDKGIQRSGSNFISILKAKK